MNNNDLLRDIVNQSQQLRLKFPYILEIIREDVFEGLTDILRKAQRKEEIREDLKKYDIMLLLLMNHNKKNKIKIHNIKLNRIANLF
jgi:hypothetical protein